jgi:cell division protein ZapA
MKQVEVTILGQSYLLACPDGGESLLHSAVSTVDQEMSAIRDAGKVKARERMAVLAALNLAYRLADRPAPGTAALPAAPAAPAREPSEPLALGEGDALVDQLIERVDAALGGSDQLF